MSRVLIVGATGLVGGHLLRLLSQDSRITSIVAPTRRPLPVTLNKVVNPHDPQLSDALAQVTEPVDMVFCCLGTTLREAGSKEAFILVDYTLVVDTALTGQRLGAQQMLVVSALGANSRSPFFYNRVKGEMEDTLIAQTWSRLILARPSMLLGHRQTRRLNEVFMLPIFKMLPGNLKAIESLDVAKALLFEAFNPAREGVTIVNSAELRERAQRYAVE